MPSRFVGEIGDLIGNQHRRHLLYELHSGHVENEGDVLTRSQGDDSALMLKHVHLPKLEEAGYVEWDRRSGGLSKGPRFDEIEPLLDLMKAHADDLPAGWP